MAEVLHSTPKGARKRKGADAEQTQLILANASATDKPTTQPEDHRGAMVVGQQFEQSTRASDDDSSEGEGLEEAEEVKQARMESSVMIGASTHEGKAENKITKAHKAKKKNTKSTIEGELICQGGDLSQEKQDKQHRKRWTHTEVHLLLLACVFHRYAYKEDPADGLVRIQMFISPTIEASLESIKIKIKNMKSAKRRHSLDQKEYDLFSAFIHAVDEESLPEYYRTELQESILALRVNIDAPALLAKRVSIGQPDGGQQEHDWQNLQIAHVLEPTAHRDDAACDRIKHPLGTDHRAPPIAPTDVTSVNIACQLLLRLDQQSTKMARMMDMLEKLTGEVERLSGAHKKSS